MKLTPAGASLTRSLGLRDVILFFVTAGTNFQWIATAAAAGQAESLLVWVLGGLLMFLPLSVCVVFLSSRHPAQGGLYVWSRLAFGPGVGFMTGWTYLTAIFRISQAFCTLRPATRSMYPHARARRPAHRPDTSSRLRWWGSLYRDVSEPAWHGHRQVAQQRGRDFTLARRPRSRIVGSSRVAGIRIGDSLQQSGSRTEFATDGSDFLGDDCFCPGRDPKPPPSWGVKSAIRSAPCRAHSRRRRR